MFYYKHSLQRLDVSTHHENNHNLDDHDQSEPYCEQTSSLDEEALHWIVILTSGEADHEKIKACQKWKKKSEKHELAFQQARQLWLEIGNSQQLQLIDESFNPISSLSHPVIQVLYQHRYLFISVFTSLCFTAAFINQRADYSTDFGEIITYQIGNQNQLILNSNSALNGDLENNPKEVTLKKGEAIFNIKNTTSTPFTVKSGNNLIQSEQGNFSVQYSTDNTTVTVISGELSIHHSNQPTQHYQANHQIKINSNNTMSVKNVNAQQITSWQGGILQFPEASLENIFNTLRNYDKRKWVVFIDEDLKQSTYNTTINIDNINEWMQGLTTATPIQIKEVGPFMIVYNK